VFTESTDLLDGSITVSGPSFHYIRTGQVYAEVGHKITLEDGAIGFQAGQDDFVEQDLEGLCDALG
jgi:hypothetical protein